MEQLPPDQLQSEQPMLLGLFAFFIVLQTLAVALRFLAKYKCNIAWGWDDIWIVCGWTTGVGLSAGAIADVIYGGAGLHLSYVEATDPKKLIVIFKIVASFPIIYLAAVVFPKFVLIHLYLRIFIQKIFRTVCWIIVGVILANWFASTVVAFKICVPFDQMWNPAPNGYCLNQNLFYLWLSFANIITDIVLLVLPIRYVWQIQISVTLRIGILFTFLLGSIGLIASIMRFVEFNSSNIEEDPTYLAGTLLIWSIVEPAVYNVAACLPSYPPLLKKWFKWITGKSTVDSKPIGHKKTYTRFGKDFKAKSNDNVIQLRGIQNMSDSESVNLSENSIRKGDSKGIRVTHRVDLESNPA